MYCGNFRGWVQYRKRLSHEDNFLRMLIELGGEAQNDVLDVARPLIERMKDA
jgi:hypothetical protein